MLGRFIVIFALLWAGVAVGQTRLDPSMETPGQMGKITVLVISGDDPFHRSRETTPLLQAALEESGRVETRTLP